MTSLRVGVVGAGARCTLALKAEECGGEVVAAADPSPQGARRTRERLGEDVAHVEGVCDLIDFGIDVAFVTSPDDTHEDVTCELLRAGIAVYLEKPLAITIEGADRILRTAYETRTPLYVGHNMRHMQVVRLLHDIVARGEIGEVKAIWTRHFVGHGGDFYFKDWHATREHGTGLLLQKGAHDIDVMHWIAGSATREVTAMGDLMVYGKNPDRADNSADLMTDWFDREGYPPARLTGLNPVIDVEDVSMMLMRLDSGVLASYQQCHFTPDYWRNYTVIGDEGRLENFGDTEGGVVRLFNRRSEYREHGDKEFPITGDAGGHSDADALTVAEFMRFVTSGGPTDTNPLSARDAVAAGIAATESLRSGSTPVRVPPVEERIAHYFRTHQGRAPQTAEVSPSTTAGPAHQEPGSTAGVPDTENPTGH
ncbi:MAG: Gfo/Idh/MocA family oxidoreductase [Bowdeniella nasicola]|nr:Gfo/Idh/MocA family oxidoreductase [Bowdeniella nasicola]